MSGQLKQDRRMASSSGSQLRQHKRIAELKTPLGPDVLVLSRFDGVEGLHEPFEYRVEAISAIPNIDFDAAIGRNCCVTFRSYEKPDRHFNGVLVEAQWIGMRDEHHAYRLVLRPWFWLLSQTSDCKMFKEKTALDIIKEVFGDHDFAKFRDATSEGYPQLEYTIQYRETDLAFVSRLMEQHGIYYYFEHAEGDHTLVLADTKSSHNPVPRGKVEYIPLSDRDRADREHIYHWQPERRFRTGKVEFNDYDYLKPTAQMKVTKPGQERYKNAQMEVYDYPGKYKEPKDGEKYAEVRLQAEQALDQRRHAAGDAISLYPGGLVRLERHPVTLENDEYLVVRCSHAFVTEHYRSGHGPDPDEIYYGHYEFLPSKRPFKAPLITPKPLVHGPQTAKVVDKDGKDSGEEIDVDEHGRIFVRFHWDRDKKPSRRVRVAQVWSGKKWGGQYIPRIGQEVVIEFLEGDPDRPLCVGTVYNNDYRYPYDMPANKTQSGVKSDSSKGGGGYNEFMFEDKKGEEKIRMHAQKDHEVTILNKQEVEIGEKFMPPMGANSRRVEIKNGDDFLKVASGHQKVDVAQTIEIKAGLMIELIVGQSKITITPAGIMIKGMVFVQVDSLNTTVNGTATLMLTGGLIAIG